MELERDWLELYPSELTTALARAAERTGQQVYVAGGAVRDWLLGHKSNDLDITVSGDPFVFARDISDSLGCTMVVLDEREGVARLVYRSIVFDVAALRGGARYIVEDLKLRDLTINALAVEFDPSRLGLAVPFALIDPLTGAHDIAGRIVRF